MNKQSYDFIDAKAKNVFIFSDYSPIICKNLIQEQTKKNKKQEKVLFALDDGTVSDALFNVDSHMVKLLSLQRHLNISMILVSHSSSSTIDPIIRKMTDVILITKISNIKLLESLFYEYFSMCDIYEHKFKVFLSSIINLHKEGPFNSLYFNIRTGCIGNAKNWNFKYNCFSLPIVYR